MLLLVNFISQKMTSLILLGIENNRILVQDQDKSFSINNFTLIEKISHTDERFLLILKMIRDCFLAKLHNNEIKNRKNGIHIPDLFWISIASVGIGENVRLQVNFETQDKEAVEFVNVMKKRLVNMFKITDGIAGTWVRSVR